MNTCMTFPETLEKFLEQYQFKDTEKIYTNGSMLVPVFRVKQWEEHFAADVRPVVRGRWKDAMQSCHDSPHVKCSVCGEYYWQYFKKFNFCPNCGADMREES